MITFEVDKVEAKPAKFETWMVNDKYRNKFFKTGFSSFGVKEGTIEAYKLNMAAEDVVLLDPSSNVFVDTCVRAYDKHIPLILGPDDVWIATIQGVAKYIEENAEAVRHALVSWEGKKRLHVQADHFVKGSPDNDWGWAFGQFGEQIEEHMGKKRDMFDPTFSTTTPVEKAAIQVQMMAALSPYFEYGMSTMCGIPQVTLLGTTEDWAGILTRVNAFGEFYPEWALAPLQEVISEFVRASAGKYDQEFWKNFVKVQGMSGGPYISGFINAFFPYVGRQEKRENDYLKVKSAQGETFRGRILLRPGRDFGDGPALNSFPSSITTVDMDWNYFGTKFNMKLSSGLFGTGIDRSVGEQGGFRPAVGWAVGESVEAAK